MFSQILKSNVDTLTQLVPSKIQNLNHKKMGVKAGCMDAGLKINIHSLILDVLNQHYIAKQRNILINLITQY